MALLLPTLSKVKKKKVVAGVRLHGYKLYFGGKAGGFKIKLELIKIYSNNLTTKIW